MVIVKLKSIPGSDWSRETDIISIGHWKREEVLLVAAWVLDKEGEHGPDRCAQLVGDCTCLICGSSRSEEDHARRCGRDKRRGRR